MWNFFHLQNPMASRELSTTTVKNDIGFPSALALTKFAAGGAMFTAFMNGFKVSKCYTHLLNWNDIIYKVYFCFELTVVLHMKYKWYIIVLMLGVFSIYFVI